MKKVWVFAVLFIMLSSLVVVSVPIDASENAGIKAPALTPHDPIYINGNANFTPKNGVTSGSGTESYPYIIEKWNITVTTGGCGAGGIGIKNTDKYFVIRNCIVHGGKSNYTNGICLYHVANGGIHDVTSYNNLDGVSLDFYSNTNTIINCTFLNNSQGISLSFGCTNNKIKNCIMDGNGYGLSLFSHSSHNRITNCMILNNSNYGVYINSSYYNIIQHNTFRGNTDNVYDDSDNYWETNYYENEENFDEGFISLTSLIWMSVIVIIIAVVVVAGLVTILRKRRQP